MDNVIDLGLINEMYTSTKSGQYAVPNNCKNHNVKPSIDSNGVVHMRCEACGFYGFCSYSHYQKYFERKAG